MRTMTCKQLGGACDKEFRAASFEEMAELCKKHSKEMVDNGDEDHVTAMTHMRVMMSSPGRMSEWMDKKRQEFNALPQ